MKHTAAKVNSLRVQAVQADGTKVDVDATLDSGASQSVGSCSKLYHLIREKESLRGEHRVVFGERCDFLRRQSSGIHEF